MAHKLHARMPVWLQKLCSVKFYVRLSSQNVQAVHLQFFISECIGSSPLVLRKCNTSSTLIIIIFLYGAYSEISIEHSYVIIDFLCYILQSYSYAVPKCLPVPLLCFSITCQSVGQHLQVQLPHLLFNSQLLCITIFHTEP